MSQLIKPKPLRPGDTIGLLAPASPGKAEELEQGVRWLQDQGFQVRLGKSAAYTDGICAGDDALRVDDLHTFFADPSIAGILCIRGGYGSMRLLPQLDYELIKRHPKVFMGYSDITALHTVLQQRCGLVSFHGPMAASDFGREPLSDFTCKHSLRALTSTNPLGELPTPPAGANIDVGALLAECKKRMPAYMVPHGIDVRGGPLPRNPNGKIDRKTLSAEWLQKAH